MSSQLSPLFTWRSAVVAAADLTSAEKLTALVLSLHMNEVGDSCFPSVSTLVTKTSLSRRTVQYALRGLEENEWLVCEPGSGKKSSRYTALVPGAHGMHPSYPDGVTGGAQDVHRGGARAAPNHVKRREEKSGPSVERSVEELARDADDLLSLARSRP